MIAIHPKDPTTDFLSVLYEGEKVRVFDQGASKKTIDHTLHHCPSQERIMLLGHGSDHGLFSRDNKSMSPFNRIMVGHPQAYYLRLNV